MTKYDRLLIHWKSIKEHLKYDSATYLLLIKNFRNLGFFEDADACYYQYRKESQSRKNWFNWSKMWDHLSWISCGYGLKIWPMLVWITGAILIFAYVYNAHNGIAKDIGNTSPIDSLYFSTFALAGRTPPDNIHPVGLWRYVALLENLLGYVFLALFVVVLGRKVVR